MQAQSLLFVSPLGATSLPYTSQSVNKEAKSHARLRKELASYKAAHKLTNEAVGLLIGVTGPYVSLFLRGKRGMKAVQMEALEEVLQRSAANAPSSTPDAATREEGGSPSDPPWHRPDRPSGNPPKDGADALSSSPPRRFPCSPAIRESVYLRLESAAKQIIGDVEFLRSAEPTRPARKRPRPRTGDAS